MQEVCIFRCTKTRLSEYSLRGLQQMIFSPTDYEFFDQLVPTIQHASKEGRSHQLLLSISQIAENRDTDIEKMCNSYHHEFASSVKDLLLGREDTATLTTEILKSNHSIRSSTKDLAEQKQTLVIAREVRLNIDAATRALGDCLDVLRLANHVHDLLGKKSHYAALRALNDLQVVHLRHVSHYKITKIIQQSIPLIKALIADAVMIDLNTWLFRIRETSQFLGEVAFFHTEQRKVRQKDRTETSPLLQNLGLNSAVELASDETVEFDALDNDEVQIDFTPLFECLHIHNALGQVDRFRAAYATTRRQQMDLLMPVSITLIDFEGSNLSELLEGIAGFAIVEKSTMERVQGLLSLAQVDGLWNSMCHMTVNLILQSLPEVHNAETVLKVKGIIGLFIQTMASWGYDTLFLDDFLLILFEKYAELLERRFGDDFLEIVSTDDYMPMSINSLNEYDKVVSVSWYTPDKPRTELNFPCVLPFSQMYPLCCIDIRNFLNQFYSFSDSHFQRSRVVDKKLQVALDELLAKRVCQPLVDRLNSQYLGQIVQILINLEHFEIACRELEVLLVATRLSSSSSGGFILNATGGFRGNKKTAEKRIFELVNSKIDDLIETAEYDW